MTFSLSRGLLIFGGIALSTGGLLLATHGLGSGNRALPTVVNLAISNSGIRTFKVLGDDNNDLLGSGDHNGIAFGDLDGDGYDEIVIGIYRGDGYQNTKFNAGEVLIVWGGQSLAGRTLNLNSPISYSSFTITRIYGQDVGDYTGRQVTCGDFNGDGYADLATGSILGMGPNNERSATGEVTIIFGNPDLRGKNIDFAAAEGPNYYPVARIYGDDADDNLGFSVTNGDINADGFADLVVGSPGGDPFDGTTPTTGSQPIAQGRVYVFWGSPALVPGTRIDLNTHGPVSAAGETRILGEGTKGNLGDCVMTGDFNADGVDDIAMGAPWDHPSGRVEAGSVYVVFGDATLPGKLVSLDPAHANAYSPAVRIHGADAGDKFGWSLGIGDIDQDARCELIAAAVVSAGPDNKRPTAGEVRLFWGDSLTSGTTFDLSTPEGSTAGAQTVFYGAEMSDVLGIAVSLTDVTGDGAADVLASSIEDDGPDNEVDNGGAFDVVNGTPALRSTVYDLATREPDAYLYLPQQEATFGYGLEAGGDVDGDGAAEIACAAIFADNPSIDAGDNQSGLAITVFGDPVTTPATQSRAVRAGDAPPLHFGNIIRATVDFHEGPSSGIVTGTINHAKANVPNALPVYWEIKSPRPFTTATVTFKYTPAELGKFDATALNIWHADSVSGPWKRIAGPVTVDPIRRTVSSPTGAFGFFALSEDLPASANQGWMMTEQKAK